MSLSPKYQSDNFSNQEDVELGVRRALGLAASGSDRPSQAPRGSAVSGADRSKRGVAQDGKVDVVVVHGRRTHGQHGPDTGWPGGTSAMNRVEAAEASLKAEREARERIERELGDAQATVRELQTRLGHTTLAIDEAREAAQQSQAGLVLAEAALAVEREARETAEKAVEKACLSQGAAEERARTSAARQLAGAAAKDQSAGPTGAAPVIRQSRVAKAKSRVASAEPKPVKWWIKPKA